jgi:hypothetical protein
MQIQACQRNPWRESNLPLLKNKVSAADIVSVILFGCVNGLDIESEEEIIVVWHDQQGNSSFVDADFPDQWKEAIANIKNRGAHFIPWAI